jgi:ABC-type nitrate/sulfonate/bicarbonate transport system substrate-binding protein
LEEKFDWVVRILKRHLQAAAWAKAYPDQAAELVARDHLTSSKALLARYSNFIDALQLDLEPDKIESLKEQKDFYLRHGFIGADIDVDKWVDHRPLNAARLLFKSANPLA